MKAVRRNALLPVSALDPFDPAPWQARALPCCEQAIFAAYQPIICGVPSVPGHCAPSWVETQFGLSGTRDRSGQSRD